MEHINLFYVISLCMYNLIVYTGRKFRAHPPIPLSMLLVSSDELSWNQMLKPLRVGIHIWPSTLRGKDYYNTQVTLIHI